MRKILGLAILFSFVSVAPAHALFPGPKTGIGLMNFMGTDDYRIGDEWGKRPVTGDELSRGSPAYRRAAMATAHVGGATGFYLGKFDGQLVMATNHHVMPEDSCDGSRMSFPLLGVTVTCDQFLGTWPEIDLALFTVKANSAADEAKLQGVAANFLFREDIHQGAKLLTVGFGVAGNPNDGLMANQDSDCYVFSQDGEYRLMGDPDQWNPGSYRAWSFAIGCDVSHGDSGSAIVDRETGSVVGIIWTGRIPKSKIVQSSAKLRNIYVQQSAAIWEELNYGVPAKKMGEFLSRLLESGMPENHKQILRAMLQ